MNQDDPTQSNSFGIEQAIVSVAEALKNKDQPKKIIARGLTTNEVMNGGAYQNYASASGVICDGGEMSFRAIVNQGNGGSGASRWFRMRVVMDGVTVMNPAPYVEFTSPYSGAEYPKTNHVFEFNYTPPAGVHSFEMQCIASTGSAVIIYERSLTIERQYQ